MLAEGGVNDLLDVGALFFRHQAVMNGHGKPLGLEQNTWDVGQLGANLCLHLAQQARECPTLFTLYGPPGRAPDVETMIASHDQVVEAHELLHVLAVAAADHDYGDALG